MPRSWKHGVCYCGASMYLYEGSDGTFWCHARPQVPHHMAELERPAALADMADARNDEATFERFPIVNVPDNDHSYGEPLSGWETRETA